MTKNYSNEELLMMDPIEVYKLRLNGSISRFPKGFFVEGKTTYYSTCAAITRYLIDEVLHFSDEDVCKFLSVDVFSKYHLYGMIRSIFYGSAYEAIENAYPGKFKPWQLSACPRNYWNTETAKEATIWLFEEKLKLSNEDICKYSSCLKIFTNNNLGGMLYVIFNNSTYAAIENAYPDKFIKKGRKLFLAPQQ